MTTDDNTRRNAAGDADGSLSDAFVRLSPSAVRYLRVPRYTPEEQAEAWRAFHRAPHGAVILDLLITQVVMKQKADMREVGQEDLVLFIVQAIQEAVYGGGTTRRADPEPSGGRAV